MSRIYQTVESACARKAEQIESANYLTYGEKDQFKEGLIFCLSILEAMQARGELYHDEMKGLAATVEELMAEVPRRAYGKRLP